MRLRWSATAYRLNGEIDKAGRPYFRGERGTPKPDLLVHVPGTKDNCAALEVKSPRASTKEIRKDIATLCRFGTHGYRRLIYLVYGSEAVLARIERHATDISGDTSRTRNLCTLRAAGGVAARRKDP